LAFELNTLKTKCQNLELEHESKDSNWATINREMGSIKSQIRGYEDELSMKDMGLDRYKGDIK
jgi:chromosome segregation ATPase